MKREERINIIKKDFENANKILSSIGDENRQKILLTLLDSCKNGGMRVNDIAKKINLSRPATSHHLKLLKEKNIIDIRKDGTKNFYYINGCDEILKLKTLIDNIELLIKER